MSNQLDRFQGLSETRWPTPALHDEPSGENRKALSRYINEYIAELEKSDAELLSRRKSTRSTPPKTWEDKAPKLPMSRQEYIKKQNALFRELTGHNSFAEMSSSEALKDSKDKQLMTTIELYMAALDEKIYMSADYSRAIIGVRDKVVRDEFDRLRIEDVDSESASNKIEAGSSENGRSNEENNEHELTGEREKRILMTAIELRDMYRDLWVQHSQLSHQRDALEVEMSQLRSDHALQFSKVLRLEYATHSLGQRLVDAQSFRTENETLKEELAKQQREKEFMQTALDAINAKYEAQSQTLDELMRQRATESNATNTPSPALEDRILKLHDELTKLQASQNYLKTHSEPTKTPLDTLDRALTLIEIARDDADKRISSLIESFAQQYRHREQELLTQISMLEQEKQIVIARCEKLERESSEANSDLSYLEQRTLSLVLMLKSVRASLDGTTNPEVNPSVDTASSSGASTNGTESAEAEGSVKDVNASSLDSADVGVESEKQTS